MQLIGAHAPDTSRKITDEWRPAPPATIDRVRASIRERAAVKRLIRGKRPSRDRSEPSHAPVDVGPRGEKRLGVGMPRRRQDRVTRPDLDYFAGVHHGDAVADGGCELEIV